MKHSSHRLLAGIAIGLAGMLPATASAALFTFTVPVEIRDVDPQYPNAKVGCTLRNAQGASLGYGVVRFSITPNSRPYSDNITVPVDPAAGKNPLEITQYECGLWLCKTAQDNSCQPAGPSEAAPTLQPQPGTPFTQHVTGAINFQSQ